MEKTDVLIVGAGPVGLMLACELQKRGVDFRIVDALPGRNYYCKALGVTPRTLEVFDLMGLLDEALDRGMLISAAYTTDGGEIVAEESAEKPGLPYPFLAMAQYDTEGVLEEFLTSHGGRVEFGRGVTSVEQDADGVTAHTAAGDIRCKWLAACDGGRSTVRKAFNTPFEGSGYPMIFLLGDVELDWGRPHHKAWKMLHRVDGELRNVLAVIPVPGNPRRYRISMAAPPEYAEEGAQLVEHPDLDFIAPLAAEILPKGTKIENLRWSSMYRISHRIVPSYQNGRVFFAGDAAHIHPPIGGQGMNTGLQDAFNLGWKLAMAAKGEASPALLDTYTAERHPVGEAVVASTKKRMDAQVADDSSDVKESHVDVESQLYIQYGPSDIVNGTRGRITAGGRVPTVGGLRRERVERSARLLDLIRGGRFHLLMHGVANPLALAAEARAVLEGHARCWYVASADETVDLQEQVPLIVDSAGEFAVAFGGAGAWLVRPDGVVGWAGDSAAELKSYLYGLKGVGTVAAGG